MFKNLLVLVFLGNTERVWKVFLPLLLEHSPNLTKLCLEVRSKILLYLCMTVAWD